MIDLKLAVRTLLRTPFVTGVAVLSLALGIGANTAIFSIFDQILLRPLPAAEPDRLVNFAAPGPKPGSQSCNQAGDCDVVLSYPMLRDLQAAGTTGFSGIAGHRVLGANIARGDRTMDGSAMLVTGSYFPVLGLRPHLGRLLQPGDDEVPGEHSVAVLSHRFWQNDLGGDAAVLNGTIVINGRAMTVVGVAPPGFDGTTLGTRPDVFVPLSMRAALNPGWDAFDNRRSYWVYVFGRLAQGTSLEQASSAINQVYAAIINETEAGLQQGMSEQTLAQFREKRLILEADPRGQSSIHEESRTPLVLLLGITGLVLLIACANIANLLLAKGARRTGEMAIRGAMGATRRQLLRRLLTEALLLAGVGGLAALGVARATLVGIGSALPPDAASTLDLRLSAGVVLFTALLAVGTGVLFGLYPAIHATRADLSSTLRGHTGRTSGARSAARFRSGLVTVQIALSMALLVAAGLFIRSLANVTRVDLGVRTDDMVTFAISPELNGYEPERSRILFDQLRDELAALPGVAVVTTAMVPVIAGNSWGTDVAVQGFESGPDIDNNSRYNVVGTDFFRALETPLIAGREFSAADGPGSSPVAIVNEAFAEKFGLERGQVVGSFMSLDDGPDAELDRQIVGFVQNAKYNSVKGEVPPVFVMPAAQQESLGFVNFYVRTAGDPTTVLRAIPDVVRRFDPNLPVEDLKTMGQQIRENVFMDRFISLLSAAFALLATLLAAIGLYGVLAYTVAQRTREIGLRMALGADTPRVRRMVLLQVGRMLIVGGIVGIVAAIALGQAAGSLLYQLEGHDPLTFVAASLLLAGVAFGAGYLPAFRASRIDPMEALRYE